LSDDAWITFSALTNLLVTGDGTLDGQGGVEKNKPKTTVLTLAISSVLHGRAWASFLS
jgi:hypothetical protein